MALPVPGSELEQLGEILTRTSARSGSIEGNDRKMIRYGI
jgi:hypothetical protein